MIQFWEEHKKKIIAVIAIAITAVALFVGGKNLNASALESVIGFVVTPFQDLTTGIGSWVENTASSAQDKTKLLEENAYKTKISVWNNMKKKMRHCPHY